MSKKIVQAVEKMVLPILEQQKLELIDVEYKKEGSNWFLRVFIDKIDGHIDIDECGKVSEVLSKELDEADLIKSAYFLEVASAGAERPLKNEKDLLKSINKQIYLNTYEMLEGRKEFEGKLLNYENEIIKMLIEDEEVSIPYKLVANVRLALVFN